MTRRNFSPAIDRTEAMDVPVALGILLLHLGALAALFWFSWFALVICVMLHWLTASIGVSLAFHRMLSHRTFRPVRWLKLLLVGVGCLALQGRPFYWVSVHRLHHVDPDGPRDPHTPRHGFRWAHYGWMLRQNTGGIERFKVMRDMLADPGLVWLNRYCPVIQLLSLGVVFLLGVLAARLGFNTSGLSCLLWGVGVRTVIAYHSTWFVNSASHRFGYTNYQTRDDARNLWWVGLLTYGEGWHNNHHAHPGSARIGLRWFELDLTWHALRALEAVRLVSHVKAEVLPLRRALQAT